MPANIEAISGSEAESQYTWRWTNHTVSTCYSSTCDISRLQCVVLRWALWSHLGIQTTSADDSLSQLFWDLPNSKRENSYPHMLVTARSQDPELSNRLGLKTQPRFIVFLSCFPLPSQAMLLLPSDSGPIAITPAQDPRRTQQQCYLLPLILGCFTWYAPSTEP